MLPSILTKPHTAEVLLEKNSSAEDWRESKHQGFVIVLFEHVAPNLKPQEWWLDLKCNVSEKE